jgi:hypothetical protein
MEREHIPGSLGGLFVPHRRMPTRRRFFLSVASAAAMKIGTGKDKVWEGEREREGTYIFAKCLPWIAWEGLMGVQQLYL